MQRAAEVKKSSGVTSVSSQATPKNQEMQPSIPSSPQKKLPATTQAVTTEAVIKTDGEKMPSTVTSQKKSQEAQNPPGLNKPPDQKRQTVPKQSNATAAAHQESGGLFGFGGSKAPPDAAKPAESVTGKMFGFGSSIFGSASALINSAVQDQPKTTPPVSPKMSPAKEIKNPANQKKDQQKLDQPEQKQTPSLAPNKVDKVPSETPEVAAASQAGVKSDRSTCPLCKVKLNMGSKDPANYNTCTGCKNTVCNQCGFNPIPNVSEVSEIHSSCVH